MNSRENRQTYLRPDKYDVFKDKFHRWLDDLATQPCCRAVPPGTAFPSKRPFFGDCSLATANNYNTFVSIRFIRRHEKLDMRSQA